MFGNKDVKSSEEVRADIEEELRKEVEISVGSEHGYILFAEIKRLASVQKGETFQQLQDALSAYVFNLKVVNLDFDNVMLTLLTSLSEKGWSIGWPKFENEKKK